MVQLLAPSSTFEARRFACAQLAVISTDTSLAAVAELLRDPDTVGMACLALVFNPSPKVNELLRAALARTDGLARVQVVATLGNRRDTAAVEPLVQLARGEDSAAAEAAIGALGKIGSAEALAVLGPLRGTANPERARAAVLASLVGADQAAQRGESGTGPPPFSMICWPFLNQCRCAAPLWKGCFDWITMAAKSAPWRCCAAPTRP